MSTGSPGNKNRKTSVEKEAIEIAMRYEIRAGRNPKVVRSSDRLGCDIRSGKRFIEVKGFYNERYPVISLFKKLKQQLGKNSKNYFIYVIYDVDKAPKLKIIKPNIIWKNLETDSRYILRGKFYRPIKITKL